ncbi:hypothetical protein L7F22_036500 [Adiantum nelumboides]|nr:hypothetical protein [Adiantum nelumboides]
MRTHLLVPCASHSIDLLIEDIGNIAWIVVVVVKKAHFIVSFVCQKQRALGICRQNWDIELAKPSSTCFSYIFIVFQNLVQCHQGLRRMIIDEKWLSWDGNHKEKGKRFENITYETIFWHNVKCIAGFMEPLVAALCLSDSEDCTMGSIYEFMSKVGIAFDTCTLFDDNMYV